MLINIVGCDGSGKTTQIQLLKPWIEESFRCPVRVVSKGNIFNFDLFPECRFFGCSYEELTDEILPQMKGESRSLILFYMMAVSICHYPPREDEVVLLDGYWHKNYATEAALGVDPHWLRLVGSFFPIPDVSILLEIEPERIVDRNHDHKPYECGCTFDCSDQEFVENQTKVFSFLKGMAKLENWIIVDARRPKMVIFDELKLLLHDRVAKLVTTQSGFQGNER